MTRELPLSDPLSPSRPDSEEWDDQERRLANLLVDLTNALRQGRPPDLGAALRDNPDLAVPLREVWAAVLVAEDLGGSPKGEDRAATDHSTQGASAARQSPGPSSASSGEFGDYELLELIGQGGMGIVYRARQRSLNRVVAVKTLAAGALASHADRARFRAEAESAARLDHPQVLPVYEVGEFEGQPYFSMKLVEGQSLAGRLADGPLPPREAALLLAPVSRAIQFAHEQGVLHRDLKPSNILIDHEGRPYVADFGLAKRLDAGAGLTHSGAILGTPAYMAPEQAASGAPLSPATDVYGLGSVLYHAICGRPPFQSASPLETILELLENEPLPPRLLNPGVNQDLEMIALRCLQKPPELRYATAGELADDLDAFLAGEPVSARSGHISQVISRILRETHHAPVLENWGLLWMWHSLVLLVLCVTTNWLQWQGFASPLPYLTVWIAGLGTWICVFWALRRRAGPVTFVERQIAHVWAASVVASTGLFFVEMAMKLPVLTLSPVLPLIGSTVFIVKAGILSGKFYIQAVACCVTAVVAALLPEFGLTLFGVVSAACFFIPGLKYYRQRRRKG